MPTTKDSHEDTRTLMLTAASKATMQWKPLLLLFEKAHTMVYFPHVIFLYNAISTPTYAVES